LILILFLVLVFSFLHVFPFLEFFAFVGWEGLGRADVGLIGLVCGLEDLILSLKGQIWI
jgi:hypothetical protein